LRYLEINFAFAQTFQIILRKNWKEELIGEVPWHVVLEFFFEKNDGTFAQAGAATHGFYLVV
jgi:hypothetical protein